MQHKLSEFVSKRSDNQPVTPEELFLQNLKVNYRNSGKLNVSVIPYKRSSGYSHSTRDEEGNLLILE